MSAFVNAGTNSSAAAATYLAATISGQHYGNTNIVAVFSIGAVPTYSVGDSAGNIYVAVAATKTAQGTSNAELFYCAGIQSAGLNTVSVTLSASNTSVAIYVLEYSGLSGVGDGTATGGSATGTAMSASVTTANATDILVALGWGSGGTLTCTQTQRSTLAFASTLGVEDFFSVSTGSQSMAFTQASSVPWLVTALALKQTAIVNAPQVVLASDGFALHRAGFN